MPLYEYQCEACGQRFELIRKFSDPPLDACTLCGKGPVTRLLSSPAIQFKGSGWYITDYARKGEGSKGEGGKGEGAKGEGSKGDAAKTEGATGTDTTSAGSDTSAKAGTPKETASKAESSTPATTKSTSGAKD